MLAQLDSGLGEPRTAYAVRPASSGDQPRSPESSIRGVGRSLQCAWRGEPPGEFHSVPSVTSQPRRSVLSHRTRGIVAEGDPTPRCATWDDVETAWDSAETSEQPIGVFARTIRCAPDPGSDVAEGWGRAREFVTGALLTMTDSEKRTIAFALGVTVNGTNLMTLKTSTTRTRWKERR